MDAAKKTKNRKRNEKAQKHENPSFSNGLILFLMIQKQYFPVYL